MLLPLFISVITIQDARTPVPLLSGEEIISLIDQTLESPQLLNLQKRYSFQHVNSGVGDRLISPGKSVVVICMNKKVIAFLFKLAEPSISSKASRKSMDSISLPFGITPSFKAENFISKFGPQDQKTDCWQFKQYDLYPQFDKQTGIIYSLGVSLHEQP